MKTTSTPPDMSKEQAAELKQLTARLNSLDKKVKREMAQDTRQLEAIEHTCHRNYSKLLRDLKHKQKAFVDTFREEKRMLRMGIHRHAAGTSATQKECAAITKRIAVLQGRLAS